MTGPDNYPAERALHRPVMTRKNAYSSRNQDTARLAARIRTATATTEMAGLNVTTHPTAYPDKCGRNNGRAPSGPDLEQFQPWRAAPEDLHARAQPPAPG